MTIDMTNLEQEAKGEKPEGVDDAPVPLRSDRCQRTHDTHRPKGHGVRKSTSPHASMIAQRWGVGHAHCSSRTQRRLGEKEFVIHRSLPSPATAVTWNRPATTAEIESRRPQVTRRSPR